MNDKRICFIGGGNMASAMINGLLQDGTPGHQITVAEPDAKRRQQLERSFGVLASADNREACAACDILILAVKPQVLKEVAENLAPDLQQRRPLCLSIAAGVRHASVQSWLGQDIPLVRVMPNTPAMIQAGASGLYAPPEVSEEHRMAAEHVMRATGMAVWLDDEEQMDALTAVSGSGPAYFFLFMEAMENTAKAMGLEHDSARLLVRQTALGAARMALESPLSLGELRSKVTSPGGTTEQAIKVFESRQLAATVEAAMQAARQRSKELSELLGKQ